MAEKGTKPSDQVDWASSAASADINSPTPGQEASGYLYNQALPHDEFNYVLKNLTDWIGYLDDGRPRTFTDLYSLCSTLGDNQTGIVADIDFARSTDTPKKDYTLGPTAVETWDNRTYNPICTDGRYLYVALAVDQSEWNGVSVTADTRMIAVDISTWEIAWSVGRVAGGSANLDQTAIACDGANVFLAQNHEIFKFNTQGLQDSSWSFDHGGNVHCIFSDGVQVFMGGASGTDSKTHRVLNIISGSVINSGNHGASVHAVITDGEFVYIGGDKAPSSPSTVGPAYCCVRKLTYGNMAPVYPDFDLNWDEATPPTGSVAWGPTLDSAGTDSVRTLAVSSNRLYVGGMKSGLAMVAALKTGAQGQFILDWDMYADSGDVYPGRPEIFGDVVSLVADPAGYLWVGTHGGSSDEEEEPRLLQQLGWDGNIIKTIKLGAMGDIPANHYGYYWAYNCSDGFNLYTIVGKSHDASVSLTEKARVQMRSLRRPPTLVTKLRTGRYRPFMGQAVSHFNKG